LGQAGREEDRQLRPTERDFPYDAPVRNFPNPVRFVFCTRKMTRPQMELLRSSLLNDRHRRKAMLVERGLRVMNVGVVSDAYAIAANYLYRTGAISDAFATDERLLAVIIKLFERGEYNKIRLANKAIAQFEALESV
jgi:hypothetical protein